MVFWRPVFFFKQKTAYEMRISDWSSDVCSSDLVGEAGAAALQQALPQPLAVTVVVRRFARILDALPLPVLALFAHPPLPSRDGQLESGTRRRSTANCPATLSRLSPPAPDPTATATRRTGCPCLLGSTPRIHAGGGGG